MPVGTARDAGRRAPPLAAELALDDDGLLVGSLTNNTGAPLADACLLAGQWGYRLGDLRAGPAARQSARNSTRIRVKIDPRAPRRAQGGRSRRRHLPRRPRDAPTNCSP